MSKWCTVAPLFSAGNLTVPFSLAGDVIISTIPDWLKTEDMMEGLGWNDRERFNLCRYALIKDYDADSLGDPDPNWRGAIPLSKQTTVLQMIHLANLALWISKPSSVRCVQAFALHASDGTWLRREFRQIDWILTSREESSTELEMRDLVLARAIHSTLIALPIDGTIWVAARTLYTALTTDFWPTRYLLLWIVLEALYGSTTPAEITFRLSQRLAFFLSREGRETRKLFNTAKSGYATRSQIVHGMRMKKVPTEVGEKLMSEAERLARDSLQKILTTPDWVQRFDSKDREAHLDCLIFAERT